MQIVSACLARDLPVYRVTFESLKEHLPGSEVHVVTRKQDFDHFRKACGNDLHLWDEAEMIPGMTLGDLRQMPLPFFPKGAGWYFQQFLKYSFANVSNGDRHFLIWDADTVLLRPIEFFTPDGRPIYTKATEHHIPYFETFKELFGREANREFSFISQHQIIDKQVLREMLDEIKNGTSGNKHWAWAIMDSLKGKGSNLFSEYETYGHYLKLKYPNSFETRTLTWTRHGEQWANYPPDKSKLNAMNDQFDFAAFEAIFSLRNRIKRYLYRLIKPSMVTDYPGQHPAPPQSKSRTP